MARILTIGNTKGGVGKSTLAVNIAIARALAGQDVWLVDGDRQGTAQDAIARRAELGYEPGVACSSYPDGATLRSQVKQQRKKYDEIIIDAGGRDSSALRAALVITDVLLVPFQPRDYDIWALEQIAALIEEAASVRDDKFKCYAMLNFADPGEQSAANLQAAKAVKAVPALKFLNSPLRRRKSYASAAGQGQCVLEYRPRDAKAIAEFNALLDKLY